MEGGLARHVHTAPAQLTRDSETRGVLDDEWERDGGGGGQGVDDDGGVDEGEQDARDGRAPRASSASVVSGRRSVGQRRAARPSGVLRWDDGGGADYHHMPRASEYIVHVDDELPRAPRKSVFAWSTVAESEARGGTHSRTHTLALHLYHGLCKKTKLS